MEDEGEESFSIDESHNSDTIHPAEEWRARRDEWQMDGIIEGVEHATIFSAFLWVFVRMCLLYSIFFMLRIHFA